MTRVIVTGILVVMALCIVPAPASGHGADHLHHRLRTKNLIPEGSLLVEAGMVETDLKRDTVQVEL
ncbi:MAG: hypothetical protein ACOYXR_06695 [Nitrospirota bacterium]